MASPRAVAGVSSMSFLHCEGFGDREEILDLICNVDCFVNVDYLLCRLLKGDISICLLLTVQS